MPGTPSRKAFNSEQHITNNFSLSPPPLQTLQGSDTGDDQSQKSRVTPHNRLAHVCPTHDNACIAGLRQLIADGLARRYQTHGSLAAISQHQQRGQGVDCGDESGPARAPLE